MKGHEMTDTHLTYSVPGMSCDHCKVAITTEVGRVAGVGSVDVDLDAKLVAVRGAGVSDDAVRAAIDAAGYDVEDSR
jgi:copper chaperone